jgi:hypothetical protein
MLPASPSKRRNQLAPVVISATDQTNRAARANCIAWREREPWIVLATAAATIDAINGGFGNWKIGKRRGTVSVTLVARCVPMPREQHRRRGPAVR